MKAPAVEDLFSSDQNESRDMFNLTKKQSMGESDYDDVFVGPVSNDNQLISSLNTANNNKREDPFA